MSIEEFERRLAEAQRDIGMAHAKGAAERATPGWTTFAVAAIREYAAAHQHFPAEHVRRWAELHRKCPPPPNEKAWGPAMKAAQKAGIIVPDGAMRVESSNLSFKVRWRSCLLP